MKVLLFYVCLILLGGVAPCYSVLTYCYPPAVKFVTYHGDEVTADVVYFGPSDAKLPHYFKSEFIAEIQTFESPISVAVSGKIHYMSHTRTLRVFGPGEISVTTKARAYTIVFL